MRLEMITLADIITQLNSLWGPGRRFGNKNQMAEFLGLEASKKPKFYNALDGKTIPRADTLLEWLGKFDLPLVIPVVPTAQNIGDYTLIPQVRPFSDLGGLISEAHGSLFAFRTDFLRHMGFEKGGDMVLLEVMGNAMEPTICEKDQVLVSLRETDIYSGQIYVIRVDGELIVKRLTREPGKILVKNDNPAHGGFEIQPDQLNVVGRVRWQGRLY